jgi:hypothetical protein
MTTAVRQGSGTYYIDSLSSVRKYALRLLVASSMVAVSTITCIGHVDALQSTLPPIISNVTVQNVTTSTATIAWTTSKPTTSEVDYGLTTSYGLNAKDNNLVIGHSIVVSSPMLVPGTTYHFVARSSDTAGNTVVGQDSIFTTNGLSIAVRVISQQSGQPIADAQVSWNGTSATTNSSGRATITGLPTGEATFVVKYGGMTTTSLTTILSQAGTQSTSIELASAAGPPWALISLLVIASSIGGSFVGYAISTRQLQMGMRMSRSRRMPRRRAPPTSDTNVPTVEHAATVAHSTRANRTIDPTTDELSQGKLGSRIVELRSRLR